MNGSIRRGRRTVHRPLGTDRGAIRAAGGAPEHARDMGRGAFYSPRRARLEAVLRRVYLRDWPARAWALLPRTTEVRVHHHRVPVLPPGHPPLRIGFASDLHIGPTTPAALLDRAFARRGERRRGPRARPSRFAFASVASRKT